MMDEEAFINEVELQHDDLSNQFQTVVDLYKEAIVSMQGEVDQMVQQLFFNLKEQLKNYETITVNDRFKCTQNRIKMLRSLHKSMASMEGAFAVLKGQYAHVLGGNEDHNSTFSNSIDSER